VNYVTFARHFNIFPPRHALRQRRKIPSIRPPGQSILHALDDTHVAKCQQITQKSRQPGRGWHGQGSKQEAFS
jgi:hypothetical protein